LSLRWYWLIGRRLWTAGGPWHHMAQKAFDGVELLRIFGGDKTCGAAGGLHSSRPTDSMDVILGTMRQIEVDHVSDMSHVDTPCRNIRCDKHPKDSALKALQCTTAF